jgi:hypothetical protein
LDKEPDEWCIGWLLVQPVGPLGAAQQLAECFATIGFHEMRRKSSRGAALLVNILPKPLNATIHDGRK